jgi:ribosome-binding factor A
MSKRIERVNELIRQELGGIMLKHFEFVGALVTITRVETSADCRYSKIFLGVLPENMTTSVFSKINKSEVYNIQKTLDKRLFMRPVPKIQFCHDFSEKKYGASDNALHF